jgi:DNA topoisomerase I
MKPLTQGQGQPGGQPPPGSGAAPQPGQPPGSGEHPYQGPRGGHGVVGPDGRVRYKRPGAGATVAPQAMARMATDAPVVPLSLADDAAELIARDATALLAKLSRRGRKRLSAALKRAGTPAERLARCRAVLEAYRVAFARSLGDARLAAALAGMGRVAGGLPVSQQTEQVGPFSPPATADDELVTVVAALPDQGRETALAVLAPERRAAVESVLDGRRVALARAALPPKEPPFPVVGLAGEPPAAHLPLIEAAADSLRGRGLFTRADFDALDARQRADAFTVAGVESEAALGKIRDVLADFAEGRPGPGFRERVEAAVGEGTFLSDHHAETVFRTAVNGALSEGQERMLDHPLVGDHFPYRAIYPIHDDRVRPWHLATETHGLDGTNVYPADSEVWETIRPVADFGCRCGWSGLTVQMAADAGVKEAAEWLRTGVRPVTHGPVSLPPDWRQSPGFVRMATAFDPSQPRDDAGRWAEVGTRIGRHVERHRRAMAAVRQQAAARPRGADAAKAARESWRAKKGEKAAQIKAKNYESAEFRRQLYELVRERHFEAAKADHAAALKAHREGVTAAATKAHKQLHRGIGRELARLAAVVPPAQAKAFARAMQSAAENLVESADRTLATAFDAAKHPRGQPENAGEFAETAGGAKAAKARPAKAAKPRAVRGEMAAAKREGKGKDARLVLADGSPAPPHVSAGKIPPQWRDVQVSLDPKADVLATGRDAAGRAKVIYADSFHVRNAALKFARTRAGLQEAAALRAENLKNRADEKVREEADCTWLMQVQATRPGSDKDTKAKVKAFGATTLLADHVVEAEDGVRLQFVGKEGVYHDHLIRDPELAKMLLARKATAGDRGGRLFDTDYDRVAKYARSLDTGRFTPKDFRTIRANQLAVALIAKEPDPPATNKEYRERVKAVAERVSHVLGNRPAQALESYIDPTVFSVWRVAQSA